jgi:outer membrane protein
MLPRLIRRARFVIAVLWLASPALSVATELGYVDMQRVLEESALGKAAQATLEERFGDEQQAFAREEAAIRQLQQTLERDRPLMSATQVEKKEAELQSRIKAFEEDFAKIQQQLARAQQQEGNKILKPARDAVISVAKKRQLGAVFEANQSGVIYLDEEADITDAVIEVMDANTD